MTTAVHLALDAPPVPATIGRAAIGSACVGSEHEGRAGAPRAGSCAPTRPPSGVARWARAALVVVFAAIAGTTSRVVADPFRSPPAPAPAPGGPSVPGPVCPSDPPVPPLPGASSPDASPAGSSVLGTADVIVLGRAHRIGGSTVKGTSVARVEVERTLKGHAEPVITVFLLGPRNTDDPKEPSVAYLGTAARRAVLFLRATPHGSGLSLDSLFLVEDPLGEEKLEVVTAEIAVAAIADPAERATRSLAHLEALLAADRPWSRTHAVRDLAALSRRAPAVFDEAALARIDVRRRTLRAASERAVLAAVLDRLDPDGARRERGLAARRAAQDGRPAAEPGTSPRPLDPTQRASYRRARGRYTDATDDEERVTALSDLARLGGLAAVPDLVVASTSPSGAARERAAVLLADLGALDAWPALRAVFAEERESLVREAIVRASGFLGAAEDLPWITANASASDLDRARCFAFARIRSAGALALLREEGLRAAAKTPPDAALAALVAHLESPAFERSDPALLLRASASPRSPASDAPSAPVPLPGPVREPEPERGPDAPPIR